MKISWIRYFLFFSILFSCRTPIKPENKIAIIGKISDRPVATKGGSKKIIYYYLGEEYFDVASFDGRLFTYNDMFLMFIDKKDPHTLEIPYPTQKIYNSRSFEKLPGISYYTNEEDFKKLDAAE